MNQFSINTIILLEISNINLGPDAVSDLLKLVLVVVASLEIKVVSLVLSLTCPLSTDKNSILVNLHKRYLPHYETVFDFLPSVHIPQQALNIIHRLRSEDQYPT